MLGTPRVLSRWLGVSLLLGACGGDDEPDDLVRAVIGPSGGQVSSKDGALTLLFQPGAVERDITVDVYPSDTPPLTLQGAAYRVKPDMALVIPVEVTFQGTFPNVPMSNSAPAVGAIRRLDFELGRGNWVPLTRTEYDPFLGVVSGLDHELALFYGLVAGDGDVGTSSSTATSTTTDDTVGPTDTGSSSGADTLVDAESTGSTTEDSESAGATSGGTESTSETGPEVILSYAVDIQPIWDANCMGAGCHSMLQNSPNLEFGAYERLLSEAPLEATVPYVDPGNPSGSYIVHKLNGTHLAPGPEGCGCSGTGSRMPLAALPLPADVVNRIVSWIAQGAEP